MQVVQKSESPQNMPIEKGVWVTKSLYVVPEGLLTFARFCVFVGKKIVMEGSDGVRVFPKKTDLKK